MTDTRQDGEALKTAGTTTFATAAYPHARHIPAIIALAIAAISGCVGEPESDVIALGSVDLGADDGKTDSLESLEMSLFLSNLYGDRETMGPLTAEGFEGLRGSAQAYEAGQQPPQFEVDPDVDLVILADAVSLRPGTANMDVCVRATPPPACPDFMGDSCNERPPEPELALMVLYIAQGADLRDGLTPASVYLDLPEPASEAKRNWKLFRRVVLTPEGMEVSYAHAAIQEGEEQTAFVPYADGASAHDFIVAALPFEVEGSFTDETGQRTYPFDIGPCSSIEQ